jgi:hypothetical protein
MVRPPSTSLRTSCSPYTEVSELSGHSEHSGLCFHNFYIRYVRYKWFDFAQDKSLTINQSWGDFGVSTSMVSENLTPSFPLSIFMERGTEA